MAGNGGAGNGSGGVSPMAGNGSGGTSATCVPETESCNAIDDDCDGTVDEETAVACYPAGTEGCVAAADGSFACVGSCNAGMQTCDGGVLSACTGAVTPLAEVCGGAEAADENCNGSVDDTCPCEGAETQRCYSGPMQTAGVGLCRAGMQACQAGVFGPCTGEIIPVPETCSNDGADDNCNGRRDDVPNRGNWCYDPSQLGPCAFGVIGCYGSGLVCYTQTAASTETACDSIDEDCDGDVDETFSLGSDENNCGACGTRCAAGDRCCGGMCRDIDGDEAHCGDCNAACGGSTQCCGGDCVTTNTDAFCGACNVACNANQDCCGGTTCTSIDTTTHCGGCNIVCGAGQACCEARCVDLGTREHCSGCNMGCGMGSECCDGQCTSAGPGPGPPPQVRRRCNGIDACRRVHVPASACRDGMGLECLWRARRARRASGVAIALIGTQIAGRYTASIGSTPSRRHEHRVRGDVRSQRARLRSRCSNEASAADPQAIERFEHEARTASSPLSTATWSGCRTSGACRTVGRTW